MLGCFVLGLVYQCSCWMLAAGGCATAADDDGPFLRTSRSAKQGSKLRSKGRKGKDEPTTKANMISGRWRV